LIEQIFSMIETKQLKAAEALLEKTRNVYELAGVVVTAQENDSRCCSSVIDHSEGFSIVGGIC